MKKLIEGVALLCLAAVANVATAAPATYVYNSQNYTTVAAPYTTAMNISGNFTTASPLPANLSSALIGPGQMNLVTSWAFSDGIETFTSQNSQPAGDLNGGFTVSTDATGAITSFRIELVSPTSAQTIGQVINEITISPVHPGPAYRATCAEVINGACSSIVFGTGIEAIAPSGTFTRAPAPTTYTYSGSKYTSATAPYDLTMGATGSFTTAAPLAANLTNAKIGPAGSNQVIAWSFDDGRQTFTHLNSKLFGGIPDSFAVSTDAKGVITAFSIDLQTPTDVTAVNQKINAIAVNSNVVQAAHDATCNAVNAGACSNVSPVQAGSTTIGTFAAPPTTYYYTGSPFTTVSSPYSTSMKVTGQIVMPSPLPPNFSGQIGPGGMNLITATSWSFSDGVQTLTNSGSQLWAANPGNFTVSTDAAGAITDATIFIYGPTGTTTVGQPVNIMFIATGSSAGYHQNVCDKLANGACTRTASTSQDQFGTTTGKGTFSLAPPASSPTATTTAATAITATSATLNGTVNANGAATTVTFDFGTTTAYGSVLPVAVLGTSSVNLTLSHDVTVSCGTAYHFRVNADNGIGGTVHGADQTFTTLACAAAQPPIATTNLANLVTASGATLNGQVSDRGADTSASFEYGLTTSYGSNVAADPAAIPAGTGTLGISATLANLACNTTYHFRTKASNSAGTGTGPDVTFITLACSGTGGASGVTSAPALGWPALVLLTLLLALARRFARRRT